ncbi:MAG: DUF3472 domain-containing protein [Bacteroidales bacterium]|nr:DUF3472 domain-containing protein [Candidatus Physcousia equi]
MIKNLLKESFLGALTLLVMFSVSLNMLADSKDKTNPTADRYNVTDENCKLAFGKSYYELDGRPSGANGNFYSPTNAGWSIKKWPDAAKHIATYLHFPKCTSDAKIQLTTTGNVTFKVVVTCMENKTKISEKTVSMKAGTQQWITVMDQTEMPLNAWYKFDIECTSGSAAVGEFFYWQFDKTANTERVYIADYLSSPSVHLSAWSTTDPTVPSAGLYDWVYQEVMIPEESAIVGTYCMSLGILHGYMGIQIDSENDYPIIFSMWDNGNTDNDPNLPDYLRSGALDWSDGVIIARFGSEGTGAQAKRRYGKNYVPGKWVKFITNARPEVVDVEIDDPDNPGQKKIITYYNTLCSAWYLAEGKDTEWQYIATIRQSGANNYFNGWYSFLENYNWPTGQWQRKAYYRNGGLHSMVNGKWYHANKVGFGHTDGGDKYGDRQDYGQGVTEDFENCFFMSTGGYHNSPNTQSGTMPLITDFNPIDQSTLDALSARVDQAIKAEQQRKVAEDFEKARKEIPNTNFKVVANNSEATNEGASNVASAILDGNENTYWHSRWSAGTGNTNYPYYVDIEVSDEAMAQEMAQVSLYQGRASNYRGKTLRVQVSDDRKTWTTNGTYTLEDANRVSVNLNTPITGKKYIRLYFSAGYGQYLTVNEVYFRCDATRDDINAEAMKMLGFENQFNGYSTADLKPLKDAYNDGAWTNANDIKQAMVDVASNGTFLKYGVPNSTTSLSSFKYYQLHNIYELGDLVLSGDAPALNTTGHLNITDETNNWLLLRSEKFNAYYLYNTHARKYLCFSNDAYALSEKPYPLYFTAKNVTINGESRPVFTIQTDLQNTKSYISVVSSALGKSTASAQGSAWELRDNYGLTPNVDLVKELLADVDERGGEVFEGEGYSIRLEDASLYLTTIEVPDGGNTTYSLAANPEYFTLTKGTTGYRIKSAQSNKSVGYSGGSNAWDIVNNNDVWKIAAIDGTPTTIYKSSTAGLGVDKKQAGAGVYTNKSGQKWIITYYNGASQTGIETVTTLDTNEPVYDLAGRRVYQTKPGHIYITSGKKVVVE